MLVNGIEASRFHPVESSADQSDADDDVALLFEQYRLDVLRFCLSKLGNREDAADIVQESFYRLLRKQDRETIERPRVFLFETAMNLIRDSKRAGARRQEGRHMPLELVSDADLICPRPSAESLTLARERVEGALQALAELSPMCQAVFVMKRFYGHSYAEITEGLGISSVVGVKKYMMRALGHLRNSVDMDETEAGRADRQAAE